MAAASGVGKPLPGDYKPGVVEPAGRSCRHGVITFIVIVTIASLTLGILAHVAHASPSVEALELFRIGTTEANVMLGFSGALCLVGLAVAYCTGSESDQSEVDRRVYEAPSSKVTS